MMIDWKDDGFHHRCCISGMHSTNLPTMTVTFVLHGAPTGELAAVAALLPQQPEVEAKRPNYFVQKELQ